MKIEADASHTGAFRLVAVLQFFFPFMAVRPMSQGPALAMATPVTFRLVEELDFSGTRLRRLVNGARVLLSWVVAR